MHKKCHQKQEGDTTKTTMMTGRDSQLAGVATAMADIVNIEEEEQGEEEEMLLDVPPNR